jgi:hypothetical protein
MHPGRTFLLHRNRPSSYPACMAQVRGADYRPVTVLVPSGTSSFGVDERWQNTSG